MAFFDYTAKDKSGKLMQGTAEAPDLMGLRAQLHKQGLMIITLKPSVKKKKGAGAKHGSVTIDEVVVFSRQLTTLIQSGIPLVQSMDILSEQTKNEYFKTVMTTITRDLKEGQPFHGSIGKHRRVFNEFFISMVKAGEASGKLPDIIDRVSTYLEETSELQKKVMSAMMYPACVITMALGITLFLIIKVVPTFKGIFDQLGGDLPMPTQILLAISDFARTNFFLGVVIVAAVVFGATRFVKTEYGKRKADQIALKLPIFGELISKIAVAKFCRTFSTLVASGVPILQALDIVGATSGNKVIEDAVLSAKKQVQAGETISDPLARSNAFPPMVIRMINIGEKTGKLQEMLTKIAKFYESEVNAAIDGLTSMIEPLIIGVLGFLIGGIVIALFMPIMKITQMVAG